MGSTLQGVAVHSFKVPSEEELNHDFLWRYSQRLPARGQIGIFNRSHYEEVLVVHVHPEFLVRQRLPANSMRGDVWKRRYREINDWERYLVDNCICIVKLFLNLSREEQRLRFLKRIDDADKSWKFSVGDLAERERRDDYQEAYSEMLTHTSTDWAPWHVTPADHKWFARIAAGAVIVHALLDQPLSLTFCLEEQRVARIAAQRFEQRDRIRPVGPWLPLGVARARRL